MRIAVILLMLLVLGSGVGCARVQVEAPKEAIKLDISMRLDVYQHVEKDIDAIEDMVSGAEKKKNPGDQSFLSFFVRDAYAEEGLSPEVQDAAARRKDRRAQLIALEEKGIVGENKLGLVEVRGAQGGAEAANLVGKENADRMIIYQGIAAKNGTSVAEVQKIYAKRLQDDAPAGTPIEVASGVWKTK